MQALLSVSRLVFVQLKNHRTLILDTLIQASFVPTVDEVMTEGLISLAKVLSQLGTGTGPAVLAVGTHVRAFFEHVSEHHSPSPSECSALWAMAEVGDALPAPAVPHAVLSAPALGQPTWGRSRLADRLAGWKPKALVRSCARPMRERFGCDPTGISCPQKDDALRTASFALFGTLAGCIRKKWHSWYKTQVRQSWAALLLHLQDPNKEVAKVRTGDTDVLSTPWFPPSSPGAALPFLHPVVAIPFPLGRLHAGTSLSSGLPPGSRAGCTSDPCACRKSPRMALVSRRRGLAAGAT